VSVAFALLMMIAAAAQPTAAEQAAAATADEFQRIAAAHRDLRAYDLRIDISLETGGSSVPLHGIVKCDGQQRCLRIFRNSTTLETPGLSLMVDANERTITVTRNKLLEGHPAAPMDPSEALQTWRTRGGRLSGGEVTAAGRHWTFASASPDVPAGDVFVDPESRLLRRLVYQSETPGRPRTTVDIRYTWGSPAELNSDDFETSRFVRERDGVIVPMDQYAHYRIIRTDRK